MFDDFWYDLRRLDGITVVLVATMVACVFCVAFVVLIAVDQVWVGKPTYFTAEIVDGRYKPDDTQTNVSPVIGVGSGGQVVSGVAVSSSGSGEEFNIMIRDFRDREVYTVEVTATVYYNYAIGDQVSMAERKGKIFGQLKRDVVTQKP